MKRLALFSAQDKPFFALTGSIALQNLILLAVSLCDNIMLGRFSETAMSGTALAIQVQFLLQQTVLGIGTGAAVIGAQYWGKAKAQADVRSINAIPKVFAFAFWLALAVSAIFTVAGFFFPHQTLGLLSDDTAVIEQGAAYMRTLAPFYPVLAMIQVGIALFRCVESTQIGVWLSLMALLFDTVLNYFFIFGKLGLPRMGAQGAALATGISYCAELALLAFYLRRGDKKLRTRIGSCFRPDARYRAVYLKTALPPVFSAFQWGLAMNVQTAIIARTGTAAIAANSIAITIFQVFSCFCYAAATAANVTVGKTIGQNDLGKVKTLTARLQIYFVLFGLLTGGLLFAARTPLLSFYKISPAAEALAASFVLVLCVTVVGTAYQMASLAGIVCGGGDTGFVFRNDMIWQWLIVIPLSAASAFLWHFPPVITFLFLKSDQILKCAVAAVKVNRFNWIRNLSAEQSTNRSA
jgi:putative MATE family efflux protein